MSDLLRRGEIIELRHVARDDATAEKVDQPPELPVVPAALIARLLLGEPRSTSRGSTAVLHLRGARVSGALRLRHATIGIPLLFESCTFEQPIDLSYASTATVSLESSEVPRLEARELRLDGELECSQLRAHRIDLFGARISGQLWLTNVQIRIASAEWAVNCPNMAIAGGFYAHGLEVQGGVNLYGADIGAGLELTSAIFEVSSNPAVRATNIITRTDVGLGGIEADGGIDLFGARIGGQLWLTETNIKAPTDGWAINAPSMTVAGGFYAHGLHTDGGVNIWGTEVGAAVEMDGANLSAPAGPALRGPRLSVRGDFTVCEAGIEGKIDLSSATIGGGLTLADTRLDSREQSTLDLSGTRLGALRLRAIQGHHISVDLTRVAVTSIEDDPDSWPETLHLDGLSYDSLEPDLPAPQRLTWLERDPDADHPHPYQQLANHYRRAGQNGDARTVLLDWQRKYRAHQPFHRRPWGYVQDVTVGYGYRPTRALAWLIALITVVAAYTTVRPPRPSGASSPGFNPVAYAVDVVLPILDLGQEKAYIPIGSGRWIAWAATLAGWVLATAVIAAISRALTRE